MCYAVLSCAIDIVYDNAQQHAFSYGSLYVPPIYW